jgi:hypothetical protein
MIRTAALLTILSSCAVHVHNGPGGDFATFAAKIADHTARGDLVIISGYCPSACTMHLAVPGACIKPGTVLGFHGATGTDADRAILHPLYAAYLPPAMAARFMAEWQYIKPGQELARITTAEAVRLGAKLCE